MNGINYALQNILISIDNLFDNLNLIILLIPNILQNGKKVTG